MQNSHQQSLFSAGAKESFERSVKAYAGPLGGIDATSEPITGHVIDKSMNCMIAYKISVAPLIVSFTDLLNSVVWETDDWDYRSPWEDCDGLEHTLTPLEKVPWDEHNNSEVRDQIWQSDFAIYSERERVLIQTDRKHTQWWGSAGTGASKQVKAEVIACEVRRTKLQLAKWYKDGWSYETVSVEFEIAGEEFSDSLGMILDPSESDRIEYANEMAGNVAHSLKLMGFTITDWPNYETSRYPVPIASVKGVQYRERLKANVNANNWAGDIKYPSLTKRVHRRNKRCRQIDALISQAIRKYYAIGSYDVDGMRDFANDLKTKDPVGFAGWKSWRKEKQAAKDAKATT